MLRAMTAKRLAQVSKAMLRLDQGANRYHVISRGDAWVVKRERAEKAIKIYAQLTEAIDRARSLAREAGGEVVVHRKDGTIAEHVSFKPQSAQAG